MPSPVRVRDATLGDVDAIAEVHTRARTAYYTAGGVDPQSLVDQDAVTRRKAAWSEMITAPGAAVLCAADEDDVVVGLLAMGAPHDDDVDASTYRELFQIHVEPGGWGRGTGSALHAAFIEHLWEAGFAGAVLEVWEANTRARAFYARRGWRSDAVRRPGPAGIDYLRLRLDLPVTAP